MKRRNFLKAAVAALLAPAALVKAEKPKPRVFYADKGVEIVGGEGVDVTYGKDSIGIRTRIYGGQPGGVQKISIDPGPWNEVPGLQDVLISPEAMEDILNWGVDEIDEQTRKEIFTAGGYLPFKGKIPERHIVGETIPFDWAVLDNRVIPVNAVLDNRKLLTADFK